MPEGKRQRFSELTSKQQDKFRKVMREYANGTLTSNGRKVSDKKQALAIAFSKAGRVKG